MATFEPYFVGKGNLINVHVGGGYYTSHSCNGGPREPFPTPTDANCMGIRYQSTDVLANATWRTNTIQSGDLSFKTRFDINNFHKERCLYAVSFFLRKYGNPTDETEITFREDDTKLHTYIGSIKIPAQYIASNGSILTIYTKRCRFLKTEYQASYRNILL